ncbi:helix-turn-helix transcriptional regulator [Sinanaerobacter sp. ZZT-01]|uniref:helix-turn-helix domain-containing protein n=1 Tax=Sinanaerobacter sp. ZZT-01 TaxID=3111540 RepID=UPI002D76DB4D|nr:helix-turn-helix transcriptional regulator [Sinanaerobacter sp. ZZT-01]WRR93512.1 helix-turn-helix transcriptional regulator [Sinanaerobacter sp. ZZT-01]
MEFNEKLQQLRKEKSMTQEKLAEQLFVSRTAISKWESGKGYPNIESLKSISKLFSISIDNLLSGEELISLAVDENRANINKIYILIFGILDLMVLTFLFLPLYAYQEGAFVRKVNLFALQDISAITRAIFFIFPILMATLGIIELVIQHYDNDKWLSTSKKCSIFLQAFIILALIATRHPYAIALMFVLFMVKVVLLIRSSRMK